MGGADGVLDAGVGVDDVVHFVLEFVLVGVLAQCVRSGVGELLLGAGGGVLGIASAWEFAGALLAGGLLRFVGTGDVGQWLGCGIGFAHFFDAVAGECDCGGGRDGRGLRAGSGV